MLLRDLRKTEKISNQMIWLIENIEEAERLDLKNNLTLTEVQSECSEEKDRGYFSLKHEGKKIQLGKKLYTDYDAESTFLIIRMLNALSEAKRYMLARKIDEKVFLSYDGRSEIVYEKDKDFLLVPLDFTFSGKHLENIDVKELKKEISRISNELLSVIEVNGNISIAGVYRDMGFCEFMDIEGDFYILWEQELPTDEKIRECVQYLEKFFV